MLMRLFVAVLICKAKLVRKCLDGYQALLAVALGEMNFKADLIVGKFII